ncbi:hypothetical protein GXW74_19770 [Roseomonas eburnea]|uniref:DdrB-like domain-containing protein n=1 Tax=Neoroseomonas eburnea TaxID=1346889 RepID=A0A9X9XGA4_9PROT|nr:hypothetical protein [Neoroseomonas eburnea]MBR0682740.1 hypothetical protein [Neoroseomonas eburnea]
MLMDLGAGRGASPLELLPELPVTPATFWERFSLDWEADRATRLSISEQRNEFEVYEQAREILRREGFNAPNPHDVGYDTPLDFLPGHGLGQRFSRSIAREALMRAYDQQVAQFRQQFPDRAGEVMTAVEVQQRARENAVRAYRASETQALVGGGALGGFLGQTAAALSDPVTAATLPFGAGARVTGGAAWNIARTALIEAGVAAGAQVPIEVTAAPYRVSLGLPADVGGSLLSAAAGGAVLGGGVRALAEGWRLLRGTGRVPDGGGGQRIDDALHVLEDQQRIVDSNPGVPPPVHEARLARATETAMQGRLMPDDEVAPFPAEARVYTPSGRAVGVRYEVAELSALTPSHTDDFSLNPAYPHAEGVQPRQRERDASRRQVDEIAAGLEPERLGRSTEAGSGAPIVGPDEVVESGNGRVLALRRVYGDPARAGQQAAYRAWLEAQGFDTAGMAQPVLIARRTTALSPDERRAFVQEANSAQSLTMSAAEQARADRDLVGRILPLYRGGDIAQAGNAEFVRAFMQGLPQTEQGRLMTARGNLSAEGGRRIRGAVIARAYGDEMGPLLDRILDSDADGMRAIAGALRDVAGPWAAMREAAARGEIAEGMDITPDLIGAVRTVLHAREKGLRVADVLAQMDLDAPPLSDNGRAMLALMFNGPQFQRPAGQATMTRRLAGYLDEAMKSQPGRDMFGAEAAPARDVLDAVSAREAEPPDPARGRQRAAAATGDRTAEVQAGAQVPDAEFLEAQRIAMQRDIQVGMDDGTRGARELLDEVEAAANDADAAAACLIGGMAA